MGRSLRARQRGVLSVAVWAYLALLAACAELLPRVAPAEFQQRVLKHPLIVVLFCSAFDELCPLLEKETPAIPTYSGL